MRRPAELTKSSYSDGIGFLTTIERWGDASAKRMNEAHSLLGQTGPPMRLTTITACLHLRLRWRKDYA
ncbi:MULTISPECIES: hypothetical protein [Sphingosinicellaceae]|uniref:hypothetical protein n=1 Tax=Sphingosinicellaceae TaxID=2820280 RepID=UPI001C1E0052|nr:MULTISPECIES: hypothetical protein [Polymorphobacter]QYE35680.1 hypothetical protein KZX46_06815 [Polymorphobacter sp. PAMC 29334]UAJ10952.1 hypothetical protein KTC28_04345 [Polymorphobacter megasporae]